MTHEVETKEHKLAFKELYHTSQVQMDQLKQMREVLSNSQQQRNDLSSENKKLRRTLDKDNNKGKDKDKGFNNNNNNNKS